MNNHGLYKDPEIEPDPNQQPLQKFVATADILDISLLIVSETNVIDVTSMDISLPIVHNTPLNIPSVKLVMNQNIVI